MQVARMFPPTRAMSLECDTPETPFAPIFTFSRRWMAPCPWPVGCNQVGPQPRDWAG